MSITFFLKNHKTTIEEESPYFDTNQPEDSFFNPRMHSVKIYPSMNLSNVNALSLISILRAGGSGYDEHNYCGELPNELLPGILEEVTKSAHPLVLNYAFPLKKLLRTAIALDDSILWG